MIAKGCGSSGGSEVLRFRSSGAAGVLVHDGAGVTAHRWLKVAFIPSHLVKATFSHHRTAPEATVTPTTSAPPRTPLSHTHRHKWSESHAERGSRSGNGDLPQRIHPGQPSATATRTDATNF